MGNSNVRSAPGTPTVSPGFERSDSSSERSQTPLYKYHRKNSKLHGTSSATSKRLPTGSAPSTPTENLPGVVLEGESQSVKAGLSPPAVLPRYGEGPATGSVFCSTPVSSGSSARESQRPRDATKRVAKETPKKIQGGLQSPYQRLLSNRPAKSHQGLDEQRDGECVPNRKLNGPSSESHASSSVELSTSSGVCIAPGEDESTDDYSSSSWNSALANQDFMKLYWPNQVDREDDPFQRASENLKEVSTEVSSLHLDLLGLLSRVDAGKRTKVPGQGSPDVSSAFRTHVNSGRDAPLDALAGEAHGSLLAMAQNWESQLLGILQKVTTSLNDLETLKGQNMSLISDSILAKSQEHPALRSGANRLGGDDEGDGSFVGSAVTAKGIPGISEGYNPEVDGRLKSLKVEVGRFQELLNKSEEERQQLEGVWLQAATEHQQEAQRLRTTLREQEARSGELAEQVRTLESERRKEQGLRTQAESDATRLQDSVQRLQKEKGELEEKLSSLHEKMQADAAEWRQFQSDLQTAVAVADDFKMEAEEQLAATRDQLVEAQRDAEAQRSELKQLQTRRLGVDTVDTTERSRTLDGRKMPKTLSVAPSLTVNGTSQAKSSSTSGAVVPNIRDNVVKSSSLKNFSTQELEPRTLTVKDVRRSSSSTRWGGRASSPTSPVESNTLTASDKWAEDSESFFRRYGGSKRGIFLQWCQGRTEGYKNVRITNFSSSWADGMALCALLHTYLPDKIPYQRLFPLEKKKNLTLGFDVAESIGIPKTLSTDEMLRPGGPDWQRVLEYVESIHQHFEA